MTSHNELSPCTRGRRPGLLGRRPLAAFAGLARLAIGLLIGASISGGAHAHAEYVVGDVPGTVAPLLVA